MGLFNFWKINRLILSVDQLIQQKKFSEAEQQLKALMDKSPNDATLMLQAAVLAFEQGEIVKAEALVTDALKGNRDNPVLHLAMGEILYKKQAYEGSMESLKACLLLFPGHPKAEYLMGLNYVALKQWDEATQHFEQVAREDNHFLLARLLTIGESLMRK